MSIEDTGIGPAGALTIEALKESVSGDRPPAGASTLATALWHAARNDFASARKAIEGNRSREAAWIRAHMLRCEGKGADDHYREAGRAPSIDSREGEWNAIAAVAVLHS